MHFDLADLRLMACIAQADSLTRGAEAAHLSLPAASARVKNLEESLGTKLLYRTSQGVTLTPPGQAFVNHARQVLQQLEALRGDLQEYARGLKGHLRLQASTSAIGEYLPPVLQAFLRSHPDVNVDLREYLSADIVRAVSEGRTDIGIVAGTVRTENLEVTPYRRDRLVLVVPEGHALAAEPDIDFERSLDEDHVGLHEASAIHSFLQRICAEQQRELHLRIQVGSFETAARMVEAGVGVAVMPASAAQRHARTMRLALVTLREVRQRAQELVALLAADARAAHTAAR